MYECTFKITEGFNNSFLHTLTDIPHRIHKVGEFLLFLVRCLAADVVWMIQDNFSNDRNIVPGEMALHSSRNCRTKDLY